MYFTGLSGQHLLHQFVRVTSTSSVCQSNIYFTSLSGQHLLYQFVMVIYTSPVWSVGSMDIALNKRPHLYPYISRVVVESMKIYLCNISGQLVSTVTLKPMKGDRRRFSSQIPVEIKVLFSKSRQIK